MVRKGQAMDEVKKDTEREEFILKNKGKNIRKGQHRLFFSEDSDTFVPSSFGVYGESRNGYRVISLRHPINGKFVEVSQKINFNEQTQEYYFDGKLVDKRKLDKNGFHISENLVGNEECNK
jgi:hypothetical protein